MSGCRHTPLLYIYNTSNAIVVLEYAVRTYGPVSSSYQHLLTTIFLQPSSEDVLQSWLSKATRA